MKIISNFSDYYDSIQRWGIDSNIVYNRKHEGGLKFSEPKRWQELFHSQIEESILKQITAVSAIDICEPNVVKLAYIVRNTGLSIGLRSVYAVINGKIYRNFILLNRPDATSPYIEIVDKHPTAESVFDAMLRATENITNKDWAKRISQAKDPDDFISNFGGYGRFKTLLDSKSSILTREQVWEFHRQLDSPVFFKVGNIGIKHASLAYYGFNNLFEGSIEAIAQEIGYCIGNIINNKNDPPIVISDNLKIEQHGFDRKKSFRHRV